MQSGGVGTLTQSGSTSLVYTRDMRIGSDGGTGDFTMTGGTLKSNWVIVGRTGGTGTFTLDGGTVLAKNTTGARLQVADGNNSTGTFHFISGSLETTGENNVGVIAGALPGFGTVNHDGGTFTTGGNLYIGRNAATTPAVVRGTGVYNLGLDSSSTAAIVLNITSGATPAGATFSSATTAAPAR